MRARAPWFDWWHADKTWQGDPMGPIYDWFDEEEEARKKPSLKEHLLAIPEVGEDKDLERG